MGRGAECSEGVRRGGRHACVPHQLSEKPVSYYAFRASGGMVTPGAMVRVKGLEPPLPYGKQILSLPRLPFRHTRNQ
jgi:hypothetical protein